MRIETVVQWIAIAVPIMFLAWGRGRAFIGLALSALVAGPNGPSVANGGGRLTLLAISWMWVWGCWQTALEPSKNPMVLLLGCAAMGAIPAVIILKMTILPLLACWKLSGLRAQAA